MKRIFILASPAVRQNAISAILNAPDGYRVEVREPLRSIDQNAAQWPILEAFSMQLMWPVDGEMQRLTPEEWKDVLTAAFKKETPRVARGLEGGVVMLGQRTSKFSKRVFAEWLEFLNAVAVLRGVDVEKYDDYTPVENIADNY